MIIIVSVVGYFLVAMMVKSYFKLYRHKDLLNVSPEEPYFVGLGWPIYLVYRLIAWPYVSGSRFVENKMISLGEKKESTKIRVVVNELPDAEFEEAEQEVESLLAQKEM